MKIQELIIDYLRNLTILPIFINHFYNYRVGLDSISGNINEKLLIDVFECLTERMAIYAMKDWNVTEEKKNILSNLQMRYQQAKEAGLEDTDIFKRYTDRIEPMSIDEAYLDVTENKLGIKSAVKIARLIQQDIWQELHLTASAGVSYNKFLAKMASDYQKPRGLTVILPDEAEDFLKQMDIAKFHGVGKKTVEKLHQMGVFTGTDLLEISEITLIDRFGRLGFDLYRKARGIDNSPVKSNRIRKSIGKEKTYSKILSLDEDIKKRANSPFGKSCS